ncbi:hypothetical protein [Lacicoccus qingdaonensis]|uniref:hypothetical protein n=1 Tax=Lacicoccus qingdaonensis TaxID=576118 RepID=UPI0015A1DA51|nr:hypothetical protein [Salinicoccus qingdaonensis]
MPLRSILAFNFDLTQSKRSFKSNRYTLGRVNLALPTHARSTGVYPKPTKSIKHWQSLFRLNMETPDMGQFDYINSESI